ncbi:hypothetical protein SBA4_530018 [Candidatus Sulfopaludibacter sp. SbA4]|nr:hypothetical protein SBA4_530018 [Candidatus Sulfopaludibacter sp. SbA4]
MSMSFQRSPPRPALHFAAVPAHVFAQADAIAQASLAVGSHGENQIGFILIDPVWIFEQLALFGGQLDARRRQPLVPRVDFAERAES